MILQYSLSIQKKALNEYVQIVTKNVTILF